MSAPRWRPSGSQRRLGPQRRGPASWVATVSCWPLLTAMVSETDPLDERLAGQLMLAPIPLSVADRQTPSRTYRRDARTTHRGAWYRPRARHCARCTSRSSTAIRDITFHHPRRTLRSPLGRARACRGACTSFVGREGRHHERFAGALGEGPLVTLTGVGGVGKTRLALKVCQSNRRSSSGDGALFCELAPLDDGSAVHSRRCRGAETAAAARAWDIEATVIDFLPVRARCCW